MFESPLDLPSLLPEATRLDYLLHVRALFKAEAQGAPIHAPAPVIAYMRRFNDEVERCRAGARWARRKKALGAEAARFRGREGWRIHQPQLAGLCAQLLDALAAKEFPVRPGNPERFGGETRITERNYVNRAFDALTKLALRCRRLDRARELPVEAAGRRLVTWYTFRLAAADGVALSRCKVREQIRTYARTAPQPSLNALNPPRRRVCGTGRSKRRLVKAAGM